MKTLKLEQNSDEWFEARKGRITGSKVKDIVTKRGSNTKIGVYQLIADRIAVDADDEDVRDRGHRLEDEAAKMFEEKTGNKLKEVGMWVSSDNDRIAISPDRVVVGVNAAVEIKCLSSANHLKAVIEDRIPAEYADQVLQYFVVNPKLRTVYTVFYDPRITAKPYHVIPLHRDDVKDEVEFLRDYQLDTLKRVDELVERLAF